FDTLADQAVQAFQSEGAHLTDGPGAVWLARGVAEIQDRLMGKLVEHRPRDRQPTVTGVEYPDWRISHPLSVRPGGPRAQKMGWTSHARRVLQRQFGLGRRMCRVNTVEETGNRFAGVDPGNGFGEQRSNRTHHQFGPVVRSRHAI